MFGDSSPHAASCRRSAPHRQPPSGDPPHAPRPTAYASSSANSTAPPRAITRRDALGAARRRQVADGGADRRAARRAGHRHPAVADGAERPARHPVPRRASASSGRPGDAARRERHGPAGVLFLDEITSAPPAVSAAAYQLILDRRLGEYQVPEGWAIFAAGNRQGDRGVTYSMPAPLANRFSHFEVDTHLTTGSPGPTPTASTSASSPSCASAPSCCSTSTRRTTRSPSRRRAPGSSPTGRCRSSSTSHLLQGTLQACVGPAAGIEVTAFVNSLDQMPDLDAICAGDEVPVPDEIDLQYAVAAALVGKAIRAQETRRPTGHRQHPRLRRPLPAARDGRDAGVRPAPRHRQRPVRGARLRDWASAVADVMLYE
jgi:hypothetical protein